MVFVKRHLHRFPFEKILQSHIRHGEHFERTELFGADDRQWGTMVAGSIAFRSMPLLAKRRSTFTP